MTKITQADIKCWKAIFSFTDEQMDIDNDDKRGLELLAAHREAAFEAGREQAEREVEWRDFHKDPPQPGTKVAIVCDDGCSTGLALITDEGVLDGEDGMPLGVTFLQGAIWMALPDNFPIAFMEAHDDY